MGGAGNWQEALRQGLKKELRVWCWLWVTCGTTVILSAFSGMAGIVLIEVVTVTSSSQQTGLGFTGFTGFTTV